MTSFNFSSLKQKRFYGIGLVILVAVLVFFLINQLTHLAPRISNKELKKKPPIQRIQTITNYDWQHFVDGHFNGSSQEKLASILLLHEAESQTFKALNYNIYVKKVDTQELKILSLSKIKEEVTKENIQTMLTHLIGINKLLAKKSFVGSQINIDRLQALQKYFQKYELSERDKIPTGADTITLDSHPANNQKELMKLLLQRMNIFIDHINGSAGY